MKEDLQILMIKCLKRSVSLFVYILFVHALLFYKGRREQKRDTVQ